MPLLYVEGNGVSCVLTFRTPDRHRCDGFFVGYGDTQGNLFFVCFSDNYLDYVVKKMSSWVLSVPTIMTKGNVGLFNMRGILVILFGVFVSECANAATFSAVKVPICGYGMYRYGNECLSVDTQAEKCPSIDGHTTYRIALDSTTFMYQEYSELICLGTHTLYEYDTNLLRTMASGGTLRTFGPPMCGYGYYRLNNKCYKNTDKDAIGLCPENFHKSGTDSASYMSLFVQDNVCLGTYSTYEYPGSLHPLYNGILVSVGAPLQTAADMRGTPCSVNSSNYYQIAVATEDAFAHPDVGACSNTSAKFVVTADCKDINTSDSNMLKQNPTCGVLCDSGVYTNSGVCADNYCDVDSKRKRLYYKRDNTVHSIPLYSTPTTTPSINIRLSGDNGVGQTCYMNLIPSVRANTVRIKQDNTTYYGID